MNQPLGRDTLDAARAVLASASSTREGFMMIGVLQLALGGKGVRQVAAARLQLLYKPHERVESLAVSSVTENSRIPALHPSK